MKLSIKELVQFLKIDIWKIKDEKGWKFRLYRWVKVFIITGMEVAKDKVFIQASALTYFSILSIVPVIATVFGISKGFGFGKDIKGELGKFFKGQEEVLEQSFVYAQNMLDNAKGGLIAGIGIVILIYVVMRLLNNIEAAFNTIWDIRHPRTWIRKFTDYLAIVIFAPILLFVSNSLTVFIKTQISEIAQNIEYLGFIEPIILFLLSFSPYFVIWILFTLLYIIMPNTRVKFKSAMIGGILAGSAFQFTQWGFITFQIGVSNYNAIYGSFAALPLFLIFTQISWTIVFIGAEFSYAHQNATRYVPQDLNMEMSQETKKKTVLQVMSLLTKNFGEGGDPLTKVDVSNELQIPYRFVADVMNELVLAGVLLRSKVSQNEVDVYLPAIDTNKMSVAYIFKKLDSHGLDSVCIHEHESAEPIQTTVTQLYKELEDSSANILVKDL